MSTSNPRAAAERRRSTARREFNQLQRRLKRDLRVSRRRAKTAAIVTRSKLAGLGVQGFGGLLSALRGHRARR